MPTSRSTSTNADSAVPFDPRSAVAEIADALCDLADRFTCDEAEALTGLLSWAGLPAKADTFLSCHGAYGDTDRGDRHATGAAVLAALERLDVPARGDGVDRVAHVMRLFSSRT